MRKVIGWGLAALAAFVFLWPAGDQAPAEPVAPRDSMPGVTRIGAARAAETLAGLPTMPGVVRWSCDQRLCEVMFAPAMWAQMPYDLKRDVTAAIGIALAHGHAATSTTLRDNLSGERLARYGTRTDNVTID